MGLLDGMLRRASAGNPAGAPVPPTCPHFSLTPRWDSADDVGHEEKVTAFRCEGCGQLFSPDEARYLQTGRSRRLTELGRLSEN